MSKRREGREAAIQYLYQLEVHGDRTADLLKMLAGDPRNWPAWETAARQWVLDHPQDENAWLALGMSLDHKARTSTQVGQDLAPMALPDAVEAYRRSLTLRDDTKTWNNLGADLDLLNRFDEAERAFAAALALDPSYALAWLNLGCTRFNAGRYELAAAALKKGLTLRPDEADAWARLAHCQRRLGQGDAAAATLRIALRHRPLAAELWLDLGLLLVDLGRMDKAKDLITLSHAIDVHAKRLERGDIRIVMLRDMRRRTRGGNIGKDHPHVALHILAQDPLARSAAADRREIDA